MKLSTPLLTTIAIGIGLGGLLTGCNASSSPEANNTVPETTSPQPKPTSVKVDTALIDTIAELPEEELWSDSCPACGKG